MSEQKKSFRQLLAELDRATEQALELSERTRPFLEDELRQQLEKAPKKSHKHNRREGDEP